MGSLAGARGGGGNRREGGVAGEGSTGSGWILRSGREV